MSWEVDSEGKLILTFPPQKKDGGRAEFERTKPARDRFNKKIERGLKVSRKTLEKEFTI